MQNKVYSYRPNYQINRPQKKPKSKYFTVAVIIIILAIGIFSAYSLAQNQPEPKTASSADDQKEDTKTKKQPVVSEKVIDLNGLDVELSQTMAQFPYDTSVYVYDIKSGRSVLAGDQAAFVGASTTKVLTAIMILRQVEAGNLTLESPLYGRSVKENLRLMINRSDNPTWKQLINYLGVSKMNSYARSLGLTTYDTAGNTISTRDMAILLVKLENKELINESHVNLLYSMMQNTSEEDYIPPAVTPPFEIFHKAGYLNDRALDAATIKNGDKKFVLVIYSKSSGANYDFIRGQQMFKQLTQKVLSRYQ